MNKRRVFLNMFFCIVGVGTICAVLAVGGCPTPVAPGSDGAEVVVAPDDGTGSVVSVEGDIVVLSGGLNAPDTGDFVVSTANGGFLRKVEGVTVQSDGTLSVRTSQATIAEAAQEGDFTFTDGPATAKRMVRAKQYEVFEVSANLDRTIYSENGVTINTSGHFSLDLTIDLDMQVRGARMHYFRSAIQGTVDLDLDGELEALSSTPIRRETSLLGQPLKKYLYGQIGPVPVVIEISADLLAGASGQVSGSAFFGTAIDGISFIRCGAEYTAGVSQPWSVIADERFDLGYDAPVWCIHGELDSKIYVKPTIEMQLYTVVGPKFDLEPYLEYTSEGFTCGGAGQQPIGSYDWELAAGIAGHATVKADILDMWMIESPTLTVFDLRWPLARGDSEPPPDLSAPSSISASQGTYTNKIRVTWNTVAEAEGYEVYRNTANNSSTATWIGTYVGGEQNQHDDPAGDDVVHDTTYYYWVKSKTYDPVVLSGFSSSAAGWLDGEPTGPECSVTPTTLNFGTVSVGQSSTRQFTVENTGTEDFYVDTSFTAGSGSQRDSWDHWGHCDCTLSPGEIMTVTVEFQPDHTGPMSLVVDFGDASGCSVVTCTGTGG